MNSINVVEKDEKSKLVVSEKPLDMYQLTGQGSEQYKVKDFDFSVLSSNLRSSIEAMGITQPTPIQKKAFDPIIDGRDILAQSMTGSGKTLAFALPIAAKCLEERNKKAPEPGAIHVLVLTPTRELAEQVEQVFSRLFRGTYCRSMIVVGGSSYSQQQKRIEKGCEVLVGTPGRVADLIRKGMLSLDDVRFFVLDEVDQMLDIGFKQELDFIRENLEASVQTLFFTATLTETTQSMARRLLKNNLVIKMKENSSSPNDIAHGYIVSKGVKKLQLLSCLLHFHRPEQALIFCETKKECADVSFSLNKQGFNVAQISSDLSQYDRSLTMSKFKDKSLQFLVATNVAARGIDVIGLPFVINLGTPKDPQSYAHRCGRTGRAGMQGHAWTILEPTELYRYKSMLRYVGKRAELIDVPTTQDFIDAILDDEVRVKSTPSSSSSERNVALVKTKIDCLSVEKLKEIAFGCLVQRLDRLENLDLASLVYKEPEGGASRDRNDRHGSGSRGYSRNRGYNQGSSHNSRGDSGSRGGRWERSSSERGFESRGGSRFGSSSEGRRVRAKA